MDETLPLEPYRVAGHKKCDRCRGRTPYKVLCINCIVELKEL